MKPTSFALTLMIVTAPVLPADNCVMQERTATQHQVVIQERSTVRREVVPQLGGGRKCMVDFRVRIGNTWHTAFGEHVWDGNQGANEACAVAASRAEDAVKQRVGRGTSVTERVLICSDRPDLQELRSTVIGTVGRNQQFRPHPEYTGRFWHRGAQCRWFVEPVFTGHDVRNFQGIICEINPDQWVVVDKF